MIVKDANELMHKRIAWNSAGGKTNFGMVVAMTSKPDVVIAEFGYGKSKDAATVNVIDIAKVYEKGDK